MTWLWGSNDKTTETQPDVVQQVETALVEVAETSNEIKESTPELSIEGNVESSEYTSGLVSGQTFFASEEAHGGLVTLLQDTYGGKIKKGGAKGGNIETMIFQEIAGGVHVLENKHTYLQNAIKETLSNLQALQVFINDGYSKVVLIGKQCEEEGINDQLASVEKIHKLVLDELDNQLGVLKNLLKVTIEPTSKSLSELVHKHKDYMKVMELLADYDYGTKEVSDRLALAFNGITQTGLIKEQVENALKRIGMTAKEYKATKNLTELRKKLYDILKKLPAKELEGEKLNDIFKGMKALEQNHVYKDTIGGQTTFGGMMKAAAKEFGETYTGGAPSRSSIKKRTTLDRRIKRKQKTTKEVIKAFIKDVNLRFNAMKDSIDSVSSKIGDSVPYDENMKEFINSFSKFGELNKENIYFALIGYDETNSTFKQMKSRFLDDLDIIMKSLEPLSKGPQGSYFNNIKQNIVSLIEVVDTYTNVLKGIKNATVATGGKPICQKNKYKKEFQDLTSNSVNLIHGTANKLSFYGKVAVIRDNLSCISKEHDKYQEGYTKILGKAIGEEITRINKDYSEKTEGEEDSDKLLTLQYNKDARVGLYKTVEAIDLYLMNFSDAIAKNPQAVHELEKMLQSTQIIAQWFVQKSGDNFKELFENNDGTGKIYESQEDVFDACKKAFESISVLKNIISMFIHIGEKFGATKLQDKIHMSANTIYKNLVKYVWVSAVSKNEKKLRNIDNVSMVSGQDDEATDDEYFVMCIKSIVAKILTVVGTYSIFNKPESRQNMITNPVRLILGGNDDTPTVNDDAIELYIRLPLLVEFYKNIFEDGNQSYKQNLSEGDEKDIVAFIPEMGSLWSGLIKIIFDKSKFITKQDLYSVQNMKDIVREINKIYQHYASSGKEKVVREAFCGLIAEINRRYGILKKCDVNEYYQLQKRYNIAYHANDAEFNTNFDILDSKDDRDVVGPSAMYISDPLKPIDNKSLIQTKDLALITEFRTRIDNQFKNEDGSVMDLDSIAKYSFEERLRFYKDELKSISSNDKKFDLVVKAIEQSNDTSKNNSEAYILFHEVVIAPCRVLETVFNICNEFTGNLNTSISASETMKVIELLYNFTGDMDGLVDLKFLTSSKVAIIYDKLQTMVSNTIDNVKYMISKFRNIIGYGLIEKYESSEESHGIYYLEDKLLKHFIKNEIINSLSDSDDKKSEYESIKTLDDFVDKLNKYLGDKKVLDEELFRAILWTPVQLPAANSIPLSRQLPQADAFSTYSHKEKSWKSMELSKIANMFNLDGKYNDDSGIVSKFNQLISNYLREFYDQSTKKIYSSLFNKTAEQTFSSIVYGKGIADIGTVLEQPATPENNVVLCASVAYTMKKLLTRSLNSQLKDKYHVLSELSEVSPHMIEEYRAKLPVFIKLFTLLMNKCMLYKRVLENDILGDEEIVVGDVIVPDLGNTDEDGNVLDILAGFRSGTITNESRMSDYKQLLTNVVEGCASMINDASNVLDEVHSMDGKSGLFFELKSDFIKDYYKITHSLPFMPASSLLYPLKTGLTNDTNPMLPNHKLNTPAFKFLYGTRSVLNGEKQGLKQMPYMTELFNKYNNSMRLANQIDSKNLEKIIDQLVCFSRYANDVYSYKSLLSDNSIARGELSSDSTYPLTKDIGELIDITQNTFVENNKERFFKFIKNPTNNEDMNNLDIMGGSKTRKDARLLNIIDMNIVPINIHALMREIPLVNLYNYSISYKQMIDSDYKNNDEASGLFKELLINPYKQLLSNMGPIETVLNGEMTDLHLFKPRFVSDQLWVKCKIDKPERLNTKIVRDTVWFANIQRMLRRKIRNELNEVKTKVMESNKITSRQLTDWDGEHKELNEAEFEFEF